MNIGINLDRIFLAKRRGFLILIFFLSLSLDVHSKDDWGSSYNLLIKGNLDTNWFLLSRSNLALRQDNKELFLCYTGVSLGYQLNNNFSARLGYRHARLRIADSWQTEQRPMSEIYYANNINGWRFTSRSRLEFRILEWRDDDIRLRQEFTFTAPWQFTKLKMQPFFEEEIFYSDENSRVEANWATLGVSYFVAQKTKIKFGYRHNRQRIRGEFTTRHTIVLGANFFL